LGNHIVQVFLDCGNKPQILNNVIFSNVSRRVSYSRRVDPGAPEHLLDDETPERRVQQRTVPNVGERNFTTVDEVVNVSVIVW
jgi:hypothetical protein